MLALVHHRCGIGVRNWCGCGCLGQYRHGSLQNNARKWATLSSSVEAGRIAYESGSREKRVPGARQVH